MPAFLGPGGNVVGDADLVFEQANVVGETRAVDVDIGVEAKFGASKYKPSSLGVSIMKCREVKEQAKRMMMFNSQRHETKSKKKNPSLRQCCILMPVGQKLS